MDGRGGVARTAGAMKTKKSARRTKAAAKTANTAVRRLVRSRGARRDDRELLKLLRPIIHDLVTEDLEDRLDTIESLRALDDKRRVSHEDLVKELDVYR